MSELGNVKIKVSVLVPIYNVETFLAECLESLISQTLKEIEIICINDGSTDLSPEIIKKYMKRDSRIVLINKKNSGYGDSMNRGLEKARGEYVGIVESDDFIDSDAFEKLYKIAKNYDLDVVKSNFYEYFTETKRDVSRSNMFLPEEEGAVFNPRDKRHIFYEQPSIWCAIYKKSFLDENNIRFLPSPGASYQDAGFNFKVWASAAKVMLLNQAFLHYRQDNPNSSVKSDGKIFAVKDEYDEVERWLRERGIYEIYATTLAGMRFSSYIWNMRRLTRKAAKQFVGVIKKDRKKVFEEGLEKQGFDSITAYNINCLPIKHPSFYLNVRPIYESKGKLLRTAALALKRLSPLYKQQERESQMIAELNFTAEKLKERINEIENKMVEMNKK